MTKIGLFLCFPHCTKCGHELILVVLEESVACTFWPIFSLRVLIPYKRIINSLSKSLEILYYEEEVLSIRLSEICS